MKPADERITDLEVMVADQERSIADMSAQLTEQWTTIEALRRKLDALTDRFLALEEASAPEIPVTKPPHW
jgi:SlyX protein